MTFGSSISNKPQVDRRYRILPNGSLPIPDMGQVNLESQEIRAGGVAGFGSNAVPRVATAWYCTRRAAMVPAGQRASSHYPQPVCKHGHLQQRAGQGVYPTNSALVLYHRHLLDFSCTITILAASFAGSDWLRAGIGSLLPLCNLGLPFWHHFQSLSFPTLCSSTILHLPLTTLVFSLSFCYTRPHFDSFLCFSCRADSIRSHLTLVAAAPLHPVASQRDAVGQYLLNTCPDPVIILFSSFSLHHLPLLAEPTTSHGLR